jgi:broad specificity phosphatase PhoE
MLPKNLVYVRHGQSLRNLAGKRAFEGDMSLFEQIITKPTMHAPLTPKGEDQARITGRWLEEQGFKFERFYVSSYVRAMQTASLLDLTGARWYVENNIRIAANLLPM